MLLCICLVRYFLMLVCWFVMVTCWFELVKNQRMTILDQQTLSKTYLTQHMRGFFNRVICKNETNTLLLDLIFVLGC